MWMPTQMGEERHAAQLKILGYALDPKTMADPTSYPLGAVVSLGGCSASFVSPEGLIITNHHCVTRALQLNSTPKENLIEDGHVAKTRADERSNGPSSRVFVTRSFRDVTAKVREGIDSIKGDLARYKKMEAQTKQLIADCEKGRPEIRCNVGSFFGGAQYYLIEQLEIRDVRLVYAPDGGVGNFGGEVDNWRWPRHSGDFAFLRAYVGKDGKPADYSPENVPYRPPHHLKLASKPLGEGDFVFVAGYPGTTNRLRTAAEVKEAVTWKYPRQISLYVEAIAILEGQAKESPERAIKAQPLIRGLGNGLTKTRGLVDGLVKGGLAGQKEKLEADLRAWIDKDPARKASYGDALDKISKVFSEHQKTREKDATLEETFLSSMLRTASNLVRMAEERPKRDADRDPDFQERNWKRLEQGSVTLTKMYDRAIDRSLLKLVLERTAKLPAAERSELLGLIVGAEEPTSARIDAALDKLYGGTKLEAEAERLKLLKGATTAELKKSTDTMIQLALKLRPLQKGLEDREDAYVGAMSLLRPRYIEALRAWSPGPIAPDANGTLRVTYGTVRSYRPTPEAPMHKAFTRVSEMVTKHTGKEPFDAPARVLEAAKGKKFGPYVDASLGEVPLDFLSDLDITGGNSGSPTLNARGELVGLAFDGNYESMASDWLFMPQITRTIHVDLRYILWLLDAVDGGDHLLTEMGAKPSID
jgi:V8-like Glu-specific endopeptidase